MLKKNIIKSILNILILYIKFVIYITVNSKELTIDNFTFFKEPIGLNDPEKEVIRDAKRLRVRFYIFKFYYYKILSYK